MKSCLQQLIDENEIRKVLALYCHACDRVDAELMGSVYAAEDSFDDHGIVQAPGPEYAERMAKLINQTTKVISHTLGQSIIQVEGDRAKAETYFIALMTTDCDDGTPRLNQLAGRFIDRLERVDQNWRIKHRTALHDLSVTLKIEEDHLETNELARGSRGADDPGASLLGLAHVYSASAGISGRDKP